MYIFKNKKIIFCFLALLFMFCFLAIFYIFTKKRSELSIEGELPKVSVVVPIYNSAKFLPACLDSIVNQTYRNIEIICVNDGSKDNSLEILNQYKQKDSRIIIINQSICIHFINYKFNVIKILYTYYNNLYALF